MQNRFLTIFFNFIGLLIFSSYLCCMDGDLPFVSSSSSLSTHSADLETVTFEQMKKDEEESKGFQEEDFEVISTQEIEESDWYCQCRFARTNNELDWTNTLKSLMGSEQTNYNNIQLCDLDNGKLGVLYTATGKFHAIRILDTNSGNCLHIINPLLDEKDPKLISTQLCRLSQNRVACILNSSGENKKIKIYDINSGKLVKDIIIENKYFEGVPKYHDSIQGIYLSGNRMALIVKDLTTYGSRFILILDLTSGKIVKKIDLVKKHDCDIFKEKTTSLVKYIDIFGNDTGGQAEVTINQALPFSDGRLLLRNYNPICIIDTNTDEVESIKIVDICDVATLPNGQWLSLDRNYFKIWDNEKFKFKTIQEVLSQDKLTVPDLQNIVLDYLSNKWDGKIISDKVDDMINLNDIYRLYNSRIILNENKILVCSLEPIVMGTARSANCIVLNVKTGKFKQIDLGKDFFLNMRLTVLDNGKRIAFYAKDGSIEIWTNQPKLAKKEAKSDCIVS